MFGSIVIIKRTGADGQRCPLDHELTVFGRDINCDIRLQIPTVSSHHAEIRVDSGAAVCWP
jgi:antigen KI-67